MITKVATIKVEKISTMTITVEKISTMTITARGDGEGPLTAAPIIMIPRISKKWRR